MKKKEVFWVAWGIFFVTMTVVAILAIGVVRSSVNNIYSSSKNDILEKVSGTEISKEDLLLKADLIWDGKKMEDIGEKAKALLKTEHPIFYRLFFKPGLYWFLFLLPFVFAWLVWKSKVEVSPEWELIAEWFGEKMEPFKNGYHFPFKYFGFFKEIAEIPVNKQSVGILSGVRDGLSLDVVEEYSYGTASNIEPGTGESLRLLYRVEFICKDSSKLFYSMSDAYEYLAVSMEREISAYVHSKSSEEVIDEFTKLNLSSILNLNLTGINVKDHILERIGLEILSLIPVDVIYSPETENIRRDLDTKKREGDIIKADNENLFKKESGKKKVLKARLINMAEEKKIADEGNSILRNRINTIKATAGVGGDEALQFINKQKTLETITESAKNGSVVYIDENSQGAASQGAALGFGINATTKK